MNKFLFNVSKKDWVETTSFKYNIPPKTLLAMFCVASAILILWAMWTRANGSENELPYWAKETDCLIYDDVRNQYICWRSGYEHVKWVKDNGTIADSVNNPSQEFYKWKKENSVEEQIEPVETEQSMLDRIGEKVCKKQPSSPLCKDKELLKRLYDITEARLPWKNWFPILIGITNAESSLWLSFARDRQWWTCFGRNNWWGTKYQINDDNTREYKRTLNGFNYEYNKAKRLHNDQYGCNLYPFKDIEEFWITKVNWMRFGYKGCIDHKTPIKCLSYAYVGLPNISEASWVRNVSEFL